MPFVSREFQLQPAHRNDIQILGEWILQLCSEIQTQTPFAVALTKSFAVLSYLKGITGFSPKLFGERTYTQPLRCFRPNS